MYTNIKKVREHNSQQFIDDFKRLCSFGMLSKSGDFYHITKSEIWKKAQEGKILYTLNDKIFVSKRTSMILW